MLLHRSWEILIKFLKSVCLEKEHEEEREVGRESLCFYLFCVVLVDCEIILFSVA